jgi:hypothetical protein
MNVRTICLIFQLFVYGSDGGIYYLCHSANHFVRNYEGICQNFLFKLVDIDQSHFFCIFHKLLEACSIALDIVPQNLIFLDNLNY